MNTKQTPIYMKSHRIKTYNKKNNIVYIFSDTHKLSRYSNLIYLQDNNGFFTPVFTSVDTIKLLKEKSKHQYNIVKTDKNTLLHSIPSDVRIQYFTESENTKLF